MDGNDGARKGTGENGMIWNQNRTDDVIINVPEDAKDTKPNFSGASPLRESNDLGLNGQMSPRVSFTATEPVRISASKPPKIPTGEGLTRRKSLARSLYSKPKTRFGEQSVPIEGKVIDENGPEADEVPSRGASFNHGKPDIGSASIKDRTVPVTPKTPFANSFRGLDEDEEIYKKVSSRKKLKHKKVRAKVLVEWLIFLCILGCLIASLTVPRLQKIMLWGLCLWKWFALVLVTFSGLLVTEWLINFVVLLIELNYLLKKKVLYFVFGLKKIVQVCIWIALVLITWALLFREGVDKSSRATTKILDIITRTIASMLVGSFLWLLKNLLLKILASSFHVNTFFDRIQESIFHQYILFSLSGKPIMEAEQMLGRASSNVSQLSVTKKDKDGREKKEREVIDINKLHQMKQEKVSAWTMKMLVDVISKSGLSTLSNALDESVYNGGNEKTDKEITNEEEAIAAAYHIFRNVAQHGCTYIDEYDMRRFMIKEEVDIVFPMIDVGETGKIDRKTLTEWVVYTIFSVILNPFLLVIFNLIM